MKRKKEGEKMKFVRGKNFRLKDKRSAFIDKSVVIKDNVTIYENNRIEGNTIIGNNVSDSSNSPRSEPNNINTKIIMAINKKYNYRATYTEYQEYLQEYEKEQ